MDLQKPQSHVSRREVSHRRRRANSKTIYKTRDPTLLPNNPVPNRVKPLALHRSFRNEIKPLPGCQYAWVPNPGHRTRPRHHTIEIVKEDSTRRRDNHQLQRPSKTRFRRCLHPPSIHKTHNPIITDPGNARPVVPKRHVPIPETYGSETPSLSFKPNQLIITNKKYIKKWIKHLT